MRSKTKRRIAALAASAVLCVAGLGVGAGAASAKPPSLKNCSVLVNERAIRDIPAFPAQAQAELHARVITCGPTF